MKSENTHHLVLIHFECIRRGDFYSFSFINLLHPYHYRILNTLAIVCTVLIIGFLALIPL